MLCSNCGKNEANVRYTRIINGEKTEFALCEDCAKKMGLEDIGQKMGLSRERVRQIKEKSLNILRSAQIGSVLKEYM